jgi:tetratricopeptide (TPR) repeat protein
MLRLGFQTWCVRQGLVLPGLLLCGALTLSSAVAHAEEPATPSTEPAKTESAPPAAPAAEPPTAEPPVEEPGQAQLQQALEAKLGAESLADLNQVIKLCQDAIDAGLAEGDVKFANELLASTLSQRAELICHELFETRVTPNRGQALLRMALSDLEKTTALNAEQPEAQYLLGRLYGHLGETDKSLAALDVAVRLTDSEPAAKSKALMIRANVQKDPAKRQADFDAAVKLTPSDPDVLRFRGMHYMTQDKLDLAIADFNAAIALDPKDAETYEARGMAEAGSGKLDESLESFSKAIEIEPKSPTALTHRARIRAMKSDIPGALADVEEAMKLQPGSQALLLHANLLAASGKFEQALGELNVLRQVMPDSPDVLLQIAAVHQGARQPQKAVEIYTQLLGSNPQNVAAFRGRADAHLNQGQQAEAVADYEEALKIDGKNSGVLNNLAWVLATSPKDDLRNGQRAIELAKQACEVTEYKQAHILSTLAAGYAETGDFDNAITWSKKAVELGEDPTKEQLAKELESYEHKKPWREAAPPDMPGVEDGTQPQPAAPAGDDTARSKRGA